MAIVPADLSSVISGILTLGANGGEELFLPKIHSVLCQMKPHNRMLAGIWFSITGSVCYSRDIENVIRDLAAQGVLKIESGSVAVVKNAAFLRNRLRGVLPTRQYKKLLATSRRFYARLGRLSGA
ncbi:MAG: hypothetical protein FIA93_06650 [Deltaproteobacteria bacterium]|nr:hypothetical protein [Deltaproteobacteria bacterium]PWB67279.1 MAG: hypothetical protein C3F14_02565 [Deltaproteobacteria bacterium]